VKIFVPGFERFEELLVMSDDLVMEVEEFFFRAVFFGVQIG
jgi:hypothetical protein